MARMILLSLFASLYLYSVDAGGHHTTDQYRWPGEYYAKMTIREEAEVYKHGQEKHIDYFTLHQRYVRAGYTRAKSFYSFNSNVQSILAVGGRGMPKCYIFDQTIPFDSLETYLKDIEGEPEGTDFPTIMADSRVEKMTEADVQTLLTEHPHITDVCRERWDFIRPTVMTGGAKECPAGTKKSPVRDVCFKRFVEGKSWDDGESHCMSLGGHLAKATSQEEYDAMRTTCPYGNCIRHWIGLNDKATEGEWVWADGSEITWSDWNEGEPNQQEPAADCGLIVLTSNKWNDVVCSEKFSYICEIPPVLAGVPRQEDDSEGEEVGVPRQEGDDDGEGEYGHEGEKEGEDYHMKTFRVVGQDIKMKCPVYGD